MKILQFGGSGQLGFEVRKRAEDLNFSLVSPVLTEVDITNPQQVSFLVEQLKPDVVLNCAAFTAVDKAEEESAVAFAINRDGARNVALACDVVGAHLIHVSTDYVFEGNGSTPLSEDAPTNPQSVYGRSKLEGEQAVLEALGTRALVVRTSSLHGQHGTNFVHTMLQLFADRDEVRVVDDQFMSPTWAGWLAEVMLDLARIRPSGVVHACCSGETSWFRFAQEILECGEPLSGGAFRAKLSPMTVTELVRPAKRPVYSVLDTSRLSSIIGRPPIEWNEGLRNHLADISRLKRGASR